MVFSYTHKKDGNEEALGRILCVLNIDWLLVSTHNWPTLFGVVGGFSYVPGCSWGWWSPKWPAKPRTSLRRTQEIVKELVVANIGEKPSQNWLFTQEHFIYIYISVFDLLGKRQHVQLQIFPSTGHWFRWTLWRMEPHHMGTYRDTMNLWVSRHQRFDSYIHQE